MKCPLGKISILLFFFIILRTHGLPFSYFARLVIHFVKPSVVGSFGASCYMLFCDGLLLFKF